MMALLLTLAMLALDPAALIRGLIYLLLAGILVCVFCYVIARLAAQFMPGARGLHLAGLGHRRIHSAADRLPDLRAPDHLRRH